MFLPTGSVVSIRERNAQQAHDANAGEMGEAYPMVVLINKVRFSASEIVAGGTLTTSSLDGRPLWQRVCTVFPLFKARGMKMTTAYYFTPSGKSVEGGITPDITSKDDPNTELDEPLDRALTKVINMAGGGAVFWQSGTVTR